MLRTPAHEMLEFDQNVPPSIYPSPEAFYLIPTGNDLITGEGKKGMRAIYEGATIYSPYEEQQLQAFQSRIQTIHMQIPEHFSRASTLRWLQGVNYNFQKCIKCMEEHFAWYKVNIPKQVTSKIYQTLKSGVFYIHGRDHKFRPCLVWNARLIKTISIEDMIEGVIYVLDYAKRNLFIPGQIENWLSVVDSSKLSASSFPRKRMQPAIQVLQNNFRARQFHIYSLNVSAGIRFLYALVSPFLEKAVKKKVTIYGGMKCKQLIKLFNPCQLEERFGGTAPNVQDFWPPIKMPEGPCATEGTLLVSKDEHTQTLKKDSRWVRPPVSRDRYPDIFKPLEQRIQEGEDLVIPDSMESEVHQYLSRQPAIEEVGEESEQQDKECIEVEQLSSDDQGNIDYETARKQQLFDSFQIRSMMQTRLQNSIHLNKSSGGSDALYKSIFKKPECFKPSFLEKKESIMIEQTEECLPETERQAKEIEDRLEDSEGEQAHQFCSQIELNQMRENSREELIELKQVVPEIEIGAANKIRLTNLQYSQNQSMQEQQPTQISTPTPASLNFQIGDKKPRQFISAPNKQKSAKCCEIF